MIPLLSGVQSVVLQMFRLVKGSRPVPDSEKRFWDRETYLDCNFPKVHGAHFDKKKAGYVDYRVSFVNELMEKNPCDELSVGSVVSFNDSKIDENRRMKINSDEMKSMASQLFQNAVQAGLIYNTFSGTLRCNVDISKLAQAKDGALRGFVLEDGEIAEHAKFCELSAAEVAPLAVFAIASFATGQYYQHVITEQLSSISQKIDQVLNLLEAKDRGKLSFCFSELERLNEAKNCKPENVNELIHIRTEIGELRDAYRGLVLNVSLEDGKFYWFDKNEASYWESALNNSKFMPYMNIAFMAEFLYYLSTTMLIGWETAQPNPSYEQIKSLAKNLNRNFMEPYAKKYHEIKCKVCLHLTLLESTVGWKKEDVCATRIRIEDMFQSFDSSVRMTLSKLNPDFYIQFENGKPVIEKNKNPNKSFLTRIFSRKN